MSQALIEKLLSATVSLSTAFRVGGIDLKLASRVCANDDTGVVCFFDKGLGSSRNTGRPECDSVRVIADTCTKRA